MANKKATMTDLRLLIREFIKGTSKRKISEILNLSRTSIDVYLGRAQPHQTDAKGTRRLRLYTTGSKPTDYRKDRLWQIAFG